jgi:hypothetical protein
MAGMCEAGSRCLARLGGRMDCLVIWGTSNVRSPSDGRERVVTGPLLNLPTRKSYIRLYSFDSRRYTEELIVVYESLGLAE